MDVQHLQGTKTSTGLLSKMEIWKGLFFFFPARKVESGTWTVNSDPKCGQPENMMTGKQAAVFKYIPNVTLPPGIKPGCTTGCTQRVPHSSSGDAGCSPEIQKQPRFNSLVCHQFSLTPNYSIPCDPYLTVTRAATLIPG